VNGSHTLWTYTFSTLHVYVLVDRVSCTDISTMFVISCRSPEHRHRMPLVLRSHERCCVSFRPLGKINSIAMQCEMVSYTVAYS